MISPANCNLILAKLLSKSFRLRDMKWLSTSVPALLFSAI